MNVQQFHTIVDKFLEAAIKRLPEDQKPCCSRCIVPHCCSEPAYCDDHEADLMLESLTPQQLTEVSENTQAWLSKARPFLNEDLPSAFPYRLANIPCPLLGKDGRCMVYANRPTDCRQFLALADPKNCAMPERIHQKYADFPQPNALLPYQQQYAIDNSPMELDHIGAHLVRKLLGFTEFTTANHQRIEFEEEKPV